KRTIYCGVDPTAPSLHVGNLVPLICMLHFSLRGHNIIPLIGGATGLVGDPSGRNTERPAILQEIVQSNAQSISSQLYTFFHRAYECASKRLSLYETPATVPAVLNNLKWYHGMQFLDFLRTVGTLAKIQAMLSKDSVRSRLQSEQGLTFTEFTYQLLQAYDFQTLHQTHQCTIQIGGSDQWGNIVAGIELISKSASTSEPFETRAFGITTPLLVTSSGEKFGKSAGNAVWIDKDRTSIFDFYQYFLRTEDRDVEKFLRLLTFLPIAEIQALMAQHNRTPENRQAQRVLASELTELIHGGVGVQQAEAATQVLFDEDLATVQASKVIPALPSDRLTHLSRQELFSLRVTKLAAHAKLTRSISESKELLKAGGLYVNGQRCETDIILDDSYLLDQRLVILRAGKSKHMVLAVS
ncbi:hypothetical protein SISNIDRAFT_404137, partial [Sistotremastrum niveocremeum HHB9708]